MARRPKPWYREARQAWFVTLDGVQHNLGPNKKEAYERFYELMRHPRRRRVSTRSITGIIDEFLDWGQKHRSSHSYEAYQRWVFRRSESKMKRITRVVYLSDKAFAITKRLMVRNSEGPLFRNSRGRPWKVSAVNCAFTRLQIRMRLEEMEQRGEVIPESEIEVVMLKLKKERRVRGNVVEKSRAELHFEAKQRLRYKRATELAPK